MRAGRSKRGYALLTVMVVLTVAATWVAISFSSMQVDARLERVRERRAVAARLAEQGLAACERGQTSSWVAVRGARDVGSFRAEVQGAQCVGEGRVAASRGLPEVTQRLVRLR